jgi:GT2 family glycosyltransferase
MPLLTVIVPTFNRVDQLRRVLKSLEQQDYPRDQFRVVVVSDGSTDGTHEYLKGLTTSLDLTPIIQKNQGPAAARNRGIQEAISEYVLFIDDDVVAAPQLLSEHMCYHRDNAQVVVIGPMLTPSDHRMAPWVFWEQQMLMKQYRAMLNGVYHATARQFYTGNTSLRREHLVAAGGFDERFRRAEDVELAYRLERRGIEFLFNPDAIGYHYANRSFRSWIDIPYVYGRNDVMFARESQEWLLPTVQEEFTTRNVLTRALVHACIDRPWVTQLVLEGLQYLGIVSHHIGARAVAQAIYSAIFNLRYYQGLADELGGKTKLFAGMQQRVVAP